MDHGLANPIRPDELHVVFTVRDDLLIKIQIHVLVVEGIDVTRTHGTVEIAFGGTLQRNLDRSAGEDGPAAEVAGGDADAVSKLVTHCLIGTYAVFEPGFDPSHTKPSV